MSGAIRARPITGAQGPPGFRAALRLAGENSGLVAEPAVHIGRVNLHLLQL